MIFKLILVSTGSFAIWLTKGFKGPFDKEMVGFSEKNSKKGLVRYFLGIGIWLAISILISVLLTRSSKPSSYKLKMNDKGEVIEIEEVK